MLFVRIPTSFLPNEDTGFIYGQVQTPPGASKERTWAALDKAQRVLHRTRRRTWSTACSPWPASTSRARARTPASLFIKLKDWDERSDKSQSVQALSGARQQVFREHQGSQRSLRFRRRRCSSWAIRPASTCMLQNRGGLSREAFLAARNQLLGEAAQGSAPRRRAPERRGGRAAVQARHRSREGECARRFHHGHQPDAGRPAGRRPTSTTSSTAAA